MESAVKPCTHFVGFRKEEYWSAVRVWGLPDYVHPRNDLRSRREISEHDTVVFANGCESRPTRFSASDLKHNNEGL